MVGLIQYVDDETFSSFISKGVILVDFYADWCGPCRMMTPVLEELAQEMQGKMNIAKLDIDSSQKTTASFQVTSIPTLILFKDGKEIKRVVGLKDRDSLKNLIEAAL